LKLALLWGPVLLVMALIFYLSSLPDPGGPPGGISDKTAHFLIYGALGAGMMRALAGGRATAIALPTILAAIVLTTLYGVSDEIHQYFVPPRTPDILDVAADAAGACAGAIAVTVLARLRPGWFRPSGAARQ
jgi:VanZ family protein